MAISKKKVVVTIPLARFHVSQVIRGLMDYINEHNSFTLSVRPDEISPSLRGLAGWPGDGVITMLNTQADARLARNLDLPVIDIGGALRETGMPRVMVDHEEIGRLAARHLLDYGFRHFAYSGIRGKWFSQLRERGFSETVKSRGCECCSFLTPAKFEKRSPWQKWAELLKQWIATLKPPVGILAVHDYWANMLIEACNLLGLRVPEEVAIVGVENHVAACEFGEITITSIARNNRKIGYEVASLMDSLMKGGTPPGHDILIPPSGLISRHSSDTLAVEDPYVAKTAHFIREHVSEEFGVERLRGIVPISRRVLECRFKKSLGCTLHTFICRSRIEEAKRLLADPKEYTLTKISRDCGFSEPRRLRIVFRKITGMSPAEYRRARVTTTHSQ